MNDLIKRFDSAASCAGVRIRRILLNLPEDVKMKTCEIRLRCGRPLMLYGLYGAVFVTQVGRESYIATPNVVKLSINDVEECFRTLCGYSVHTHQNNICRGYVTVNYGHRAGISGTAVTSNGTVTAVKSISSINIRISKEFNGVSDELFEKIKANSWKSVIIAGPPSSGKTTLLRDLARNLASEKGGYKRTVIVDERDEIAACFDGIPQNDVGISSDVLSSYSKGEGVMIALRSMSPENIILDEIGSEDEAACVEAGLNSGVNFFLTAHASDVIDLMKRKQIKRLINSGGFDAIAFLDSSQNPSDIIEYITVGDLFDKACGRADNNSRYGNDRVLYRSKNF